MYQLPISAAHVVRCRIPPWDDMVGLISIAVQPNQKFYELGRWSVKVSLTQIGTTFGLDVPPERPEPGRVHQTPDYCTSCVRVVYMHRFHPYTP